MSGRINLKYLYSEFRIFPFPSSKRTIKIFRPIIPITLLYGRKFVQFAALIDSGADYNIFHGDIASYLGINLTSGSKRSIVGIGGKIKSYVHTVKIKIGDYTYKAPIAFSNYISDNSMAALGNEGFFERFIVKFDYFNKTIQITK